MMHTFVDLFAGGGGFTRGLVAAGLKPLVLLEKGHWEAETLRKNFPSAVVMERDIRDVHSEDILRYGKPSIVVGGPPCEAYTAANASRMKEPHMRLYEDPRGRLTLHFIRMVGDMQPEVFIMENVPSILAVKEFLRYEFGRVGYEVHFNVIEASEQGVPSQRRRVFISNIRLRLPRERPPTVLEAIGDIMELDESTPNHKPSSLTKKLEEKAWKLRWNSSLTKFKGAGGIYKSHIKLHPFRIAPTIMGSSRFIHPLEGRLLTPREHARLMSFPDYHVFYGPLESQYNMAGEAVPPRLSYLMGRNLIKVLPAE